MTSGATTLPLYPISLTQKSRLSEIAGTWEHNSKANIFLRGNTSKELCIVVAKGKMLRFTHILKGLASLWKARLSVTDPAYERPSLSVRGPVCLKEALALWEVLQRSDKLCISVIGSTSLWAALHTELY